AALQGERDALGAYAAPATVVTDGAPANAAPSTGSLLLAAPPLADEQRPLNEEERRRRRRRIALWTIAALAVAAAVVLAIVLGGSRHTVPVPDVSGQTEQQAGATLRHAGLDPVPSLAASSTVPTGLVVSQSPAGGLVIDKGSRVNIVIS